MNTNPSQLPVRTVSEWSFPAQTASSNPFLDVMVEARFTAPDGKSFLAPAFYDGDQIWKVRFNPGQVGLWSYQVSSRPQNGQLARAGQFEVTASPSPSKGFLTSVPGKFWGYAYESGEPAFLMGDTVYNL